MQLALSTSHNHSIYDFIRDMATRTETSNSTFNGVRYSNLVDINRQHGSVQHRLELTEQNTVRSTYGSRK